MWLVNWLIGRASKILEWFGGSYNTWVLRLRNFFTWLRWYRDQAFSLAKNYLFPKILSYYYLARSYIVTKYNSAVAWTNHIYQVVRNFITIEIIKTRNFFNAKTINLGAEDQRLASQIVKSESRLKTFLTGLIQSIISIAFSPLKWILVYRDLLRDLKELFSKENLEKLVTLLSTVFPAVLTFAIHPISSIIAILRPIFLDLLSYSLAYALGTEEAELPAWPDWLDSAGGGYTGGANVPAGASRGLVAPLGSLRISGYIFREGHRALDLGLSNGQPIFAMHSGTVEYTNQAYTGYGFQVTIRGGDWWTRYAHCQALLVKKGQSVRAGQTIALGNSTGNSTGPHLHLEIKYKGSFIDPAKVLF